MNELLSALIGAASALILAYGKNQFDLRKEISSELLERRFETYKEIWGITQVLPKWPRAENVSYKELKIFSQKLQAWYFQTGGWLLSTKSQKLYRNVQEEIQNVLHEMKNPGNTAIPKEIRRYLKAVENEDSPLISIHYDRVQERCSKLRTQLTTDLKSRVKR